MRLCAERVKRCGAADGDHAASTGEEHEPIGGDTQFKRAETSSCHDTDGVDRVLECKRETYGNCLLRKASKVPPNAECGVVVFCWRRWPLQEGRSFVSDINSHCY